MKRTLHASAMIVTMIAVALAPTTIAMTSNWCLSDATETNVNYTASPTAERLARVETATDADLEVNKDSDGTSVDTACDGQGGGGGEEFGIGTLYCDSRISCDSMGVTESGCSSTGYWEVDGEVVGGDVQYGVSVYTKCNGTTVADCDIKPDDLPCTSTLEKGIKGGLECDFTVEAGDEDVLVDVKCKDPPMPAQTGMLVEKVIHFDAETATKTVESMVVWLLPALPLPE